MEDVDISDPRVLGIPALDAVLGSNDLYSARFTLRHDTRDMPFLPTEGHLIELSYEQAFGEFDYPRGEVDYRRYFLVRERPDGSGRHVLAASIGAGVSGTDTPLFENYFAGGFTTLARFRFPRRITRRKHRHRRRPLPHAGFVRVHAAADGRRHDPGRGVRRLRHGGTGRPHQLGQLPRGPGFGFRITVPALGPAPLAFDFAFPVCKADTDDTQVFSFFFGFGRG